MNETKMFTELENELTSDLAAVLKKTAKPQEEDAQKQSKAEPQKSKLQEAKEYTDRRIRELEKKDPTLTINKLLERVNALEQAVALQSALLARFRKSTERQIQTIHGITKVNT